MTGTKGKSQNLGGLSFEEALNELEKIVSDLEKGDVSLDDAIAAFERGTALKAHCKTRLEEARMKVEKIQVPTDGSAPSKATPFSAED